MNRRWTLFTIDLALRWDELKEFFKRLFKRKPKVAKKELLDNKIDKVIDKAVEERKKHPEKYGDGRWDRINDVSPKEREDLIKAMNAMKTEESKPFVPVTHISNSKLYKPRSAYQKRMWSNNKPLPKHGDIEDEEE